MLCRLIRYIGSCNATGFGQFDQPTYVNCLPTISSLSLTGAYLVSGAYKEARDTHLIRR